MDANIDLNGGQLQNADLTRADLTRANLTRANLSGANLIGADLTRAKLSGANLTGAKLIGGSLWNANLSNANVTGANLSNTRLWSANLTGANLTDANLTGANLWKANLGNANLNRTVFARSGVEGSVFADSRWNGTLINGIDLRTVGELNLGEHENPSSVGVDTLYLTAGGLPLSEMPEPYRGFFIACGVNPELFEAKQLGALELLRQVTGELAGKQQSGILGASAPAGALAAGDED